jgi:hypothetical protein
MGVSEYTFAFFRDRPQPVLSRSLSFANDLEAIRVAGEMLGAAGFGQVSIGRGSGDEPKWLGACDWNAPRAGGLKNILLGREAGVCRRRRVRTRSWRACERGFP